MPFTKITAAGIDTTGTLITQQLSVIGIVRSTGLLTGTYAGNYRNVAYSWDPDLLTTTTDIELPGFGGQNTQNNQTASVQSGGHAYAVIYY
jgi:hypothetical protein